MGYCTSKNKILMPSYQIKLFILFLLINLNLNAFSQENSIYQNYFLSPFIINPAITGAENYPMAELSYRTQWLGFTDAPGTFLLSGNFRAANYDYYTPKAFLNKGPIKIRDRVGLGGAFFYDRNGPLSNTGLMLSYAYHFPISHTSWLSFGLSVMGEMYSLNTSMLKPDMDNDAYLLSGNGNVYRANFNIGIYYCSNLYFGGLSANKIPPDVTNATTDIKVLPSYFLISGYKFMKNNNTINIEPSATIKKIGNEKTTFDVQSKFYIKKLNWVSLSYSTTGNMNFRFAIRLYKMVYAGYHYEFTIGKISSYNNGSHEISLGINLGLTRVEGIQTAVN
jgi:type IX secretion system PorP/SprF family membrane protein